MECHNPFGEAQLTVRTVLPLPRKPGKVGGWSGRPKNGENFQEATSTDVEKHWRCDIPIWKTTIVGQLLRGGFKFQAYLISTFIIYLMRVEHIMKTGGPTTKPLGSQQDRISAIAVCNQFFLSHGWCRYRIQHGAWTSWWIWCINRVSERCVFWTSNRV